MSTSQHTSNATGARVSFIGGGNMASALIGGMLERGFSTDAVQVVELTESACLSLRSRFGVRAETAMDAAFLQCDLLILAVKPQGMQAALSPLVGCLQDQVVVSIAAGIRATDLVRWLGGHERVIRAMPNTPALIGAGVTGLYASEAVSAQGRMLAERVLAAVGQVVWVAQEALIDSVTAVSGSGPAYVFRFIEALERAACEQGLDAATARTLALETVLGAARLAQGSDDPPGVLRERVTSKGGTTAAALASLEQDGFLEIIGRAVAAACKRGHELGEELGRG